MTELTALLMCSWRKWAAGGESRRQTKGGRVSLDIYTSLTLPVSGCSHSCCLPEKCHSEECFFFFLPPSTTQTPLPPSTAWATMAWITKAKVLKKQTNWWTLTTTAKFIGSWNQNWLVGKDILYYRIEMFYMYLWIYSSPNKWIQ